jgi:hypothetical protein
VLECQFAAVAAPSSAVARVAEEACPGAETAKGRHKLSLLTAGAGVADAVGLGVLCRWRLAADSVAVAAVGGGQAELGTVVVGVEEGNFVQAGLLPEEEGNLRRVGARSIAVVLGSDLTVSEQL